MAEVICVGVAVLDHVFDADLPASSDSKTFARTYAQFGSGMAATASAQWLVWAEKPPCGADWAMMIPENISAAISPAGAYRPSISGR